MRKRTITLARTAAFLAVTLLLSFQSVLFGQEIRGKFKYDDFLKPNKCLSCHESIFRQWEQSMMAQSFTHHWDEIEYFDVAVKHAENDPKLKEPVDGCNGCHAPLAYMAGDLPTKRPSEKTRANESVSCEVCHTITGFMGDGPFNFNFSITPGRTKFGNRKGVESPEHKTEYSDFIQTAELCGTCHNEKNPFGNWVKSTQLEWAAGPYKEQGVACHQCHMPVSPGKNAKMSEYHDDIAQHLFHGAHVFSKINGSVEMLMQSSVPETEPGYPVVMSVQLFNGKCGHKIPSGSVEDRIMWLHVEARDSKGKVYHLPVDKKGFEGEEYTIATDQPAYFDLKYAMGLPDSYKGLPREDVPIGDRIFRMPYLDPEGYLTICQWNAKTLGTDYRIGPRETKIETFTWNLPDNVPEGEVTVTASVYYRKLVKPVGDFLKVPEDETEAILINTAEAKFEVYY
ncbi:multiheme c-type cytochrome [Candidatus Latescibacterota bacterium]